MERIGIFGSGGREHSIAHRAREDYPKAEIICYPGNGGMRALRGRSSCVPHPMKNNIQTYQFLKRQALDFAIIGPEGPIIEDYLSDILREAGVPVLAPSSWAAVATEGSKRRFKGILKNKKYDLPTPSHSVFRHDELRAAMEDVRERGGAKRIVLKADGLCSGKGVVLPDEDDEAAADFVALRESFGSSAEFILVEHREKGREFSAIGITDGEIVHPLAFVQDYKRAFDGDQGPNTGGMGAHTVYLDRNTEMAALELLNRVVEALRKENILYQGIVYLGLMITEDGRLVILECNCRGGDPETQIILSAMEGNFIDLCYAAAVGDLKNAKPLVQNYEALGVYLTSIEYPNKSISDHVIENLIASDTKTIGAVVYHGGTGWNGTNFTTNRAGRILMPVGRGQTLAEAHEIAYNAIRSISAPGTRYRSDIGKSFLTSAMAA